jgi:hypothetical protein
VLFVVPVAGSAFESSRHAPRRFGHVTTPDSKLLLNSPHPLEYFSEQLPIGWTSCLGGDGFKIASKVLGSDARGRVGDLGQIARCSGWLTDYIRKRSFVDLRLLVTGRRIETVCLRLLNCIPLVPRVLGKMII